MLLFLLSACCLGGVSSQLLGLQEEEECRALGGGQGICRVLSQCKTAGDFKTNHPPICTFKNKEPVICCPNSLGTKSKPGSRADQLCAVLDLKCRRNLNLSKNVIGGVASAPRTHTYMALIGYGNENQISWGCGGSLITKLYVLSAAHCVNPSTSLGMARWARLGDLDISSNSEDAKPINKRIVERITYPDYVDTQVYHDIAIFKLDSDAVFNQWVMPICLQTQLNGEPWAKVIGWGRTDFAEGTSDQLLEAEVNVYNDTECQRLMFSSTNGKTPRGYQPNLMFCAGVPDGSKDACLGDSGGPLVIRKVGECVKTQIGITSYGNQCGLKDSPGVYTRVSNYVSWIEDIVFADDVIF